MSRDFFNKRADIWDADVAEKDPAKLEALSARLEIAPGATVLDVGTGTGVFVPYLLRKIEKKGRLVCLDFAEKMLDIAQSKGFGKNISYICADVDNSGLPDKTFDDVVCYSVFPHFENKRRALGEMSRVLKRGGHLYIAHTSSRQEINEIHRSLPEICHHLFPENTELREMLTRAGFTDITIDDREDSYFVSARRPV